MARTDARKQEFIAAIQTVAGFFAEQWWDGRGNTPTVLLSPPADADDEQLLSRTEVVKLLDVSPRTLDRLVKDRKLAPVRVTGTRPKFRQSEIEKFIRRRE